MPILNGNGTKFVNSLGLKGLLQAQLETEVLIKSFTIEPASIDKKHGTRTELNRIFVQYSSDSTRQGVFKVIAKVKPLVGTLAEEFSNSDAFEKETLMYQQVLPNLTDILRKIGVKVEFSPQLLFTTTSPTDVLFLKDLSELGFSTESPSAGLTLDQAKFAMEKLAFFHAASAYIIQQVLS